MSELPPDARVLIVRMGALGDIVHALPVLAAIRAHRPDVEVDWLVDARYAGVLALVDGLRHRVVVRSATAGVADREVRFAGLTGLAASLRFMRARRYAAAVDLQGLIKSAMFVRGSGARRVVGFARFAVARIGRGHVLRRDRCRTRGRPRRPEEPRRAAAARRAVGRRGVPLAADRLARGGRRERRRRPSSTAGGFALVNPGAAWDNKRWPAQRFGQLAARLGRELGLPSIVTWGPAERALADDVVAHAGGFATASPPTALADLLSLAGRARLVVSGDTGPLHLAASVGAPIVGLFGPTRPERNGPWRPEDACVSRAATCVCFHKRHCLRGHACIEEITPDEVFEACVRRMGRAS